MGSIESLQPVNGTLQNDIDLAARRSALLGGEELKGIPHTLRDIVHAEARWVEVVRHFGHMISSVRNWFLAVSIPTVSRPP